MAGVLGGLALLATVAAARIARAASDSSLGAMSESWLAEHRASHPSSAD